MYARVVFVWLHLSIVFQLVLQLFVMLLQHESSNSKNNCDSTASTSLSAACVIFPFHHFMPFARSSKSFFLARLWMRQGGWKKEGREKGGENEVGSEGETVERERKGGQQVRERDLLVPRVRSRLSRFGIKFCAQ